MTSWAHGSSLPAMKRLISILLIVLAVASCGEATDDTRFETAAQRFDLSGSHLVVSFPDSRRVVDEFLSLVVNFDGLQGVFGMASMIAGVDLGQEHLLEASGISPDFRPLLFEHNGALVAVIGLADQKLWSSFVKAALERAGKSVTPIQTVEKVTLWPISKGIAWATHGNLWVMLFADSPDAMSRIAALMQSEPPPMAEELPHDRISFRLKVPAADIYNIARPFLGQMGPAAGLGHSIVRMLEGCKTLTGTIEPGDKYKINLVTQGCSFPFAGELTFPPETALADDAVATISLRRPVETLADWLSQEQWALVSEAWRMLSGVPPALKDLSQVLKGFEPELSLAFLGLSKTISVTNLTQPKKPSDPLFALHLQLVLNAREGVDLNELLGENGLGALVADLEVKELPGEKPGTEYCLKENTSKCFSLILDGRRVIAVTGAGEGARLQRVLTGQAPSLAQSLFVKQDNGPLTLTLKTRRLVRDLRAIEFPPYFVAVISSVLESRLVVSPVENGSQLQLEIVLR